MRLATLEDLYRRSGRALTSLAEMPARVRGIIPLTAEFEPNVSVAVYANHGRWVVECPFCRGAQLATFSDPRFLCADCGNVNIGGRWVRVIWPDDAGGIEDALVLRPSANQNWVPGETAETLRRENIQHGIGGR